MKGCRKLLRGSSARCVVWLQSVAAFFLTQFPGCRPGRPVSQRPVWLRRNAVVVVILQAFRCLKVRYHLAMVRSVIPVFGLSVLPNWALKSFASLTGTSASCACIRPLAQR